MRTATEGISREIDLKLQHLALATLLASLLGACASNAPMHQPPLAHTLEQQASAGPLAFVDGRVEMDNDAAFADKLALVEGAKQSLDLAYYIFDDDYSSSRLSQALIDAAKRGVKVRLLVDYFSEYKDLDRFSWLEQEGKGRIEVRFYNRPTLEIVKDAAFLTLSCADVGVKTQACDTQKLQAVEQRLRGRYRPALHQPQLRRLGPVPLRPLRQEPAGHGLRDHTRTGH